MGESYPLAVIIAVPLIAAFTVLVLLPRLRRFDERREARRRRRPRRR